MSASTTDPSTLAVETLREAFDRAGRFTVGVEEELMLLDRRTLDLAPESARVLRDLEGDERFRPELPAAQLEVITDAAANVPAAIAQLAASHRTLRATVGPGLRVAGAGTHPFASPIGVMSDGARYQEIVAEYGWAAVRGMVFGLHIHVAVGGADRSLAVYNALRSYLPQVAALAGNAPFLAGADTGLASVRPKIAEGFPRQGIPPALPTWQDYADLLSWGRNTGAIPDAKHLWWELRLHPTYGTIEVRAPDMPTRLADTGAIVAVVQALMAWLAERHDRGERLPVAADVRIAENRWRALRHGLDGTLVDLVTGEPQGTRQSIADTLDALRDVAWRLGSAAQLAHARALLRCNGAQSQRAIAAERGLHGLVGWLADRFDEPLRPG
ncbi:MAG: glutamate--cysteine ligase [Solirubrobacterales bacterium]|nr:glutamate--cysteine ligase [Solirubrobacterales bacterium]